MENVKWKINSDMDKSIIKIANKDKLKTHGEKIYHKVNHLARTAHVHRVIIKNHKREPFIKFPMTLGIALVLILPILAGFGLFAFLWNDWEAAVERIEHEETP
jgi:hypothetical protein